MMYLGVYSLIGMLLMCFVALKKPDRFRDEVSNLDRLPIPFAAGLALTVILSCLLWLPAGIYTLMKK